MNRQPDTVRSGSRSEGHVGSLKAPDFSPGDVYTPRWRWITASSARSSAAGAAWRREHREAPVRLVEQLRPPAGVDTGPVESGPEVLEHAQGAEDAPVLGHVREPEARQPVGGRAGDVAPVEDDRAPGRAEEAHDRLEGRTLPDPVPAEHAHHLARPHFDGDAVEDVALAVERVQLPRDQDHVFR